MSPKSSALQDASGMYAKAFSMRQMALTALSSLTRISPHGLSSRYFNQTTWQGPGAEMCDNADRFLHFYLVYCIL